MRERLRKVAEQLAVVTHLDGGRATVIHAATGPTSLGPALVAVTDRGVCAVLTGSGTAVLQRRLRDMFPHAELAPAHAAFTRHVEQTLHQAEPPALGRSLSPEIRRVALEERIRRLLRGTHPGAPCHGGLAEAS